MHKKSKDRDPPIDNQNAYACFLGDGMHGDTQIAGREHARHEQDGWGAGTRGRLRSSASICIADSEGLVVGSSRKSEGLMKASIRDVADGCSAGLFVICAHFRSLTVRNAEAGEVVQLRRFRVRNGPAERQTRQASV